MRAKTATTDAERTRTDGGTRTMNTIALDGDVAIVTGSSRGMGRATAERLAGDGASVVVNYVSSEGAARDVVDGIEGNGGEAIAVQADVSQASDVERLFDEAEDTFGTVDAVVNCAGTSVFGPLAEITEEDFDRAFDLNAKGTFLMLREAATRISDDGCIVDFSSAGTTEPNGGDGAYLGGKAAGEMFVQSLAKELGERGVRVNSISPGVTDTDGLVLDQETIDQLTVQTPLGRLGQPEDIADVVAFLVSDDARWLTGQNIKPTGGL